MVLSTEAPEFNSDLLAGNDEGAVSAHQIARHSLLVKPYTHLEEEAQALHASFAFEGSEGVFCDRYEASIQGVHKTLARPGHGDEGAATVVFGLCFLEGPCQSKLPYAFGDGRVIQLQRVGCCGYGHSWPFAGNEQHPELVDG